MEQKVIQIGNSIGITLPRSFVKKVKLKVGDKVIVDQAPELEAITIQTKRSKKKTGSITLEFFYWVEKFNREHADVLKELARR